jgi:hypothetical protein
MSGNFSGAPKGSPVLPCAKGSSPPAAKAPPHVNKVVKEVVKIAWSTKEAYCGDKPTLSGTTKNYSDGEMLPLQIKDKNSTKTISRQSKIAGNSFSHQWEFKDYLPTKTGAHFVKQMELLGTAGGKETQPALIAHFIPDATKTAYSKDRSHFELSASDYVVKIQSDILYVKGWGASVVDLGNSVPAGTGGIIADFTWSGYRWMKKVGVKNQYWDGSAWKDLPRRFRLIDANNFCVGFYKSGSSYKCQYGGTWPENFTDWDVTSKENVKKITAWKNNIETVWSNKFFLKRKDCPSTLAACCRYSVIARVEFSKQNSFSSGTLIISNGDIRSNDQLWFIADPEVVMAAHEFGHHLGNPDEYAGAKLDTSLNDDGARAGIDADSIMGQNMTKVKKRHFRTVATHFASIIKNDTGKSYVYEAVK